MTTTLFALILVGVALTLRVRSIRRRGVWSKEALYFFFCAALAALLLSPHLAGTSRIVFAEESQVTGADRVPTVIDQIGFGYAALIEFAGPVIWLLGVVALEAAARAWAGRGGIRIPAAGSSPRSSVARGMGMPLIVALCVLVGPALILWVVLRVALADPTLLVPTQEKISDSAFLYSYALGWLAALLGLYCLPAQLWLPDWAPRSGGAHPWANPSPNALFGRDFLAQLSFPSDLFQFLMASTPWIIAAVLLAWLYSSISKR